MAKYSKSLVNKICKLIESDDYTVSELCLQTGISEAIYYRWRTEKVEFLEKLQAAEQKRLEFFRKEARSGLLTLLHGKEYEEVTTEFIEGKPDKDGNSKPKIKLQRKVKKFILPNPTSVIFALKNLDNENFADILKQELTGKDGGPIRTKPEGQGEIDYSKLSDDVLEALAHARIHTNGVH